ncbi:hypothetical protein BC828DRAFT_407230 [Blastocladiella britannica]|nr:hypothetical protein BC828DRAFT_407230 [Blastocladiella britannica]
MVFCMVGSTLSGLSPISRASLVAPTMAVASASLLAASQSSSLPATFLAFCAFEATVGVYFPTIFALRSAVVPESVRGTALSAFRVPLNAIVVALLTQVGKAPVDSILVACSGILAVAAVAGGVLARRQSTVAAVKPKSE